MVRKHFTLIFGVVLLLRSTLLMSAQKLRFKFDQKKRSWVLKSTLFNALSFDQKKGLGFKVDMNYECRHKNVEL
jgi:hypothetical protein